MRTFWASVIAATAFVWTATAADAVEWRTKTNFAQRTQPHMAIYGVTRPPIGYIGFCKSYPAECIKRRTNPVRVIMTKERWRELSRINKHINKAIEPVTDQELYNEPERWTYPKNRGDCEDYVLLKRRYLINLGWPAQALLITVARDQNNEGHAVLTASTDIGDFILDNQSDQILPWQDTPYRYVKRQSQSQSSGWVNLDPVIRVKPGLVAGG